MVSEEQRREGCGVRDELLASLEWEPRLPILMALPWLTSPHPAPLPPGGPQEPTVPWSFYSLARVVGKEPGFGIRPALNLVSAFI